MTMQDLVIFGIVVFGAVLSVLLPAKFPAYDPNAKRLAYLERRVSELSALLGIEEEPLSEVQELIARGLKINAIKLYREQTEMSLSASKDAVDNMAAQMKARGLA